MDHIEANNSAKVRTMNLCVRENWEKEKHNGNSNAGEVESEGYDVAISMDQKIIGALWPS